ncbi:hypothetical protein A2841_01280 [Candidatus Kaiserbacteria bacterium RIFCSPHIGHO2_01_FULL_48_10]|uniref:Peptidoglycan binding-like domain-containing protein n=1 Tax=Candidatus Kaiserbacteria bacterium RIFCSPHIGHO2_01_FULL_48_10 TaxID=1798476 RepID=A0A1F6C2W7_9BACT|nr:MAG: hypothetical protein A2841_01280 [Candidatus Kaiserbacteria bacterium RIFCSPHIGHO2_01_FULL_48_10]
MNNKETLDLRRSKKRPYITTPIALSLFLAGGTTVVPWYKNDPAPELPTQVSADLGEGETVAYSVAYLQKVLRDGNFYRGPVNNHLDESTKKALQEFQNAHGLKATGTFDASTASALEVEMADQRIRDRASKLFEEVDKKS